MFLLDQIAQIRVLRAPIEFTLTGNMATNVVMPKMGESITEGTILRWLKKEGDQVQKDEPILEISTDKVDTEVPSPVAGTLLKILAQENETIAVGNPIATIGQNGESGAEASVPAAQPAPKPIQQEQKQPEQKQPAPQASAPKNAEPQSQAPKPQAAAGGAEQPVVMPKMGESITEGTILRWLKKEGEQVKKDEPILEISTDKVDTEVPSPYAGTLTKVSAQEGETIAVGATLAYISTGGGAPAAGQESNAAPQQAQAAAPAQAAPHTAQQPPQQQQATQPQQSSAPKSQPVATPPQRMSGDRFYSPLVRTMAKEEGISQQELDSIQGSGLEGRVTKQDVQNFLKSRGAAPQAKQQTQAVSAPAPSRPSAGSSIAFEGQSLTIPMDNIRQRIAEHMVRSKHTSAHVTSVTEVDVTNIVNFRNKFKDDFKKREGVNLTYTPIFIEAMVRAIKDFPIINSSVDGTNIIVKKEINFGVAVSLPQVEGSPMPPALIVPVIKRAGELNYVGLAKAVADLAARARSKKLTPDDISGGTFTLTNPGMYGNLFGTPIINQPQVAIMTVGSIEKRVVVKTDPEGNDYMAIRSMMFLGLSYDHRVIDGMYGVQFTDRVKQYLEEFNLQSI